MSDKKKTGAGVGVMMLREGKILLGKRHGDPNKAGSELHGEGTWTMVGGKIDFGETFEETAVREIMEETSLRVEPKDLKLISLSNDRVPDAQFVTIGFLCEKFEGEPKVMEPNEITEWQLFDLNNLPENLFFPSANILKNYLNKSIYSEE